MKTEIIDIEEIEELIIAYANGNFSKRLELNSNQIEKNSIVAGVNMLGEELQATMISRDFFSSIFNSSTDFMVVLDTKGSVKEVNNEAEKTLSISRNKSKGLSLFSSIPYSANNAEFIDLLKQHITTNINGHFEANYYDGKEIFPIACSISKISNRNNKQEGFLISGRDLTEKKNQEHKIYMAVVAALEKERKRLAYDLHDSFSQDLNAIKIFIDNLTRLNREDPNYKKSIDTCKSVIENAINSARGMAFDLLPKSLEKGDLTYAIRELCNKYPDYFNFDLQFDIDSINLDLEVKTIIYRIIQEFLNNSIKHSESNNISIYITQTKNKYEFVLKDNGVGFDMKKVSKGNGLHNIMSRLNAINANHQLSSTPGKGTTLKFTIS